MSGLPFFDIDFKNKMAWSGLSLNRYDLWSLYNEVTLVHNRHLVLLLHFGFKSLQLKNHTKFYGFFMMVKPIPWVNLSSTTFS